MRFASPLVQGVLLSRYKRFLADIRLEDGRVITAHCPNPGRMTSCLVPGGKVHVSPASNPARKLKWTWEIAWVGSDGRVPVLVNTAHPNAVVEEAILAGILPGLTGYRSLRREVRCGERSRIDIRLEDGDRPPAWVEVKNVTLLASPGVAAFPDARTTRGERHLRTLAKQVTRGDRGVLVFHLGRGDATRIEPADAVDPSYGKALREVANEGVELMGLATRIDTLGVVGTHRVPIDLPVLD